MSRVIIINEENDGRTRRYAVKEGEEDNVLKHILGAEGFSIFNAVQQAQTPKCHICKERSATRDIRKGLDFNGRVTRICSNCDFLCNRFARAEEFQFDKSSLEFVMKQNGYTRAVITAVLAGRANYLSKNGIPPRFNYTTTENVCVQFDGDSNFKAILKDIVEGDVSRLLEKVSTRSQQYLSEEQERANATAQSLLEEEANAGAGKPKKRRRRKKAKKITKIKTKIVEETQYDVIDGVPCVRNVKKTVTIRR